MIEAQRNPCDEGILWSGECHIPGTELEQRWVLVTAILGSSLAFIVGSVVSVALPAIQAGLNATTSDLQWIVNSYMLFLSALILIGGSAGDVFGQRRIFLAGTSLFAIASLLSGLAPSVEFLILARAVQGVGAALLVPTSLALISTHFPRSGRGRAIGTWAGFSALTTALGPVLGGWLVDTFSWRWAFLVVAPLAAATALLAALQVPRDRFTREGNLDWLGAILASGGLGVLTFGLIRWSSAGIGSPVVLTSLIAGAAALAGFVIYEGRAGAPMMPLHLFRNLPFTGANLITLFLYFALNSVLFFLPLNLIQVQGYTATEAGAAFLPFTLLVGLLSRWTGGFIERFGARWPLVVGPLVTGAGYAYLAIPGVDTSYWTGFFPGLLLMGLGMAIAVAPLTTVVMSSVDDEHAGTASGINNAVSRVAGLLAVALLGSLAVLLFGQALQGRLSQLSLDSSMVSQIMAAHDQMAGMKPPASLPQNQDQAVRQAIDLSFVYSFRWLTVANALLAVVSGLAAGWLIPKKVSSDQN
jgi:EmrB/QacA subfamily drug resistance transporter